MDTYPDNPLASQKGWSSFSFGSYSTRFMRCNLDGDLQSNTPGGTWADWSCVKHSDGTAWHEHQTQERPSVSLVPKQVDSSVATVQDMSSSLFPWDLFSWSSWLFWGESWIRLSLWLTNKRADTNGMQLVVLQRRRAREVKLKKERIMRISRFGTGDHQLGDCWNRTKLENGSWKMENLFALFW